MLWALVLALVGAVVVFVERGGLHPQPKPLPHGVLTMLQGLLAFVAVKVAGGTLWWLPEWDPVQASVLAAWATAFACVWMWTVGTGYLINPAGPKQPYDGDDGGAAVLQWLKLIRKEDGKPMGLATYLAIQGVNVGFPVLALVFTAGPRAALIFPLTVLLYWKVAPVVSSMLKGKLATEFVGAGLVGFMVYLTLAL